MTAPAIQIRLTDVVIGERRRDDLGDIDSLAKSIKKYGLFHPIIVDPENRLIAGERRLRACESLGWEWVPARQWDELSEAELREIELEENQRRKDLTSFEQSKTMVERISVAREIAETCSDSEQVSKPARGPSQTPGSIRDVAERTGIPQTTIHKAEQHVATAEAYPVFQKPDWKQYHVLEARTHLDKLPEEQRPNAVAIIDEPAIPPRLANSILNNLATMPDTERTEIFELHQSPDSRDRSLAGTRAAQIPPMPDPRVSVLYEIEIKLNTWSKKFPDDPFNPRFRSLLAEVKQLSADIIAERKSA